MSTSTNGRINVETPVTVESDGRTEQTTGGLAYGIDRPCEVIMGFGGPPRWSAWAVDVSVVIAGTFCTEDAPAGRGVVRICGCSAHDDCVSVSLRGDEEERAVVHFPERAFMEFVQTVIDKYEDPQPVADEELAAQIEAWS